jgi:spore maturation protein CgeB
MKILYVAMEWDYGFPERGRSFEDVTFYDTFSRLSHELHRFDFMALFKERGPAEMNRRLRETAMDLKPDLLFCVLFKDEIDPAVMTEITRSGIVTLNWFCDDHWRFDSFSRRWAPCFRWVTTTDPASHEQYLRLGMNHAILTQWACNHFTYRPLDLPMQHDVTFVGQPHGDRRRIVEELRRRGIVVRTWGTGWESGRLPQEEMIRVFNQSKINLNFSNAWRDWRRFWQRRRDQIKGRHFEIPGCGGFQLSSQVEGLDRFFEPGREIAVYRSTGELVEKIRHYLAHEEDRRAIAEAGYARTLRDHTYEKRFAEIFRRVYG